MEHKPCPFCGSNELIVEYVGSEDREGVPMAVTCMNCGCQGPWEYEVSHDYDYNSWKAWDERV